jgi:polyhydroxybutyrate depolymerase
MHNNCQVTPQVINYPNVNLTDLSTATNYRYLGGREGSSVELIKVTGGGHAWPGALPVLAQTNLDFSASKEIWRFFRPYRLNQFTSITDIAEAELRSQLRVFPNPSQDVFYVEAPQDARIQAFDAQGRLMGTMQTGALDVSNYPTGLYSLQVQYGQTHINLRFQKQ